MFHKEWIKKIKKNIMTKYIKINIDCLDFISMRVIINFKRFELFIIVTYVNIRSKRRIFYYRGSLGDCFYFSFRFYYIWLIWSSVFIQL